MLFPCRYMSVVPKCIISSIALYDRTPRFMFSLGMIAVLFIMRVSMTVDGVSWIVYDFNWDTTWHNS